MKERIKNLAEQAGLEMCSCGCDMPTRQTAKFAEMLIQEVCFDMMNVHLDKNKISTVAKSWGVEVL